MLEQKNEIRLGYICDSHFRLLNPVYRKDSFKDAIAAKMADVKQIGEEYELDALLHGGDMFDTHTISEEAWVTFGRYLQDLPFPTIAIPGNHDIEAHNLTSLPRTPIGYLGKLGIITLISNNIDNPILIEKNGLSVQISGAGFHGLMDNKFKEQDYVVKNKVADYSVHMVHGNLLDKPAHKLAHYTLIDEIKHTLADVTLGAHWHMGFPLTTINDKGFDQHFFGPGAFIRRTKKEMLRTPVFTIITISEDGVKVETVNLPSAKPTEEILDLVSIENKAKAEEELNGLINEIRMKSSDMTRSFSMTNIVEEISQQENISEKVRNRSLEYISEARQELKAKGKG